MRDAIIREFVGRVVALKERFREDMSVIVDEMRAAAVDPATINKTVSLITMDEAKRDERDTLLDLYRAAAGIDPPMANIDLHLSDEDWKARGLFDADLSVREVAKRMKISTGKAHKLRVRWRAFKLFTRSPDDERSPLPPHDKETGEIHEPTAGASPRGDEVGSLPVRTPAVGPNSPPDEPTREDGCAASAKRRADLQASGAETLSGDAAGSGTVPCKDGSVGSIPTISTKIDGGVEAGSGKASMAARSLSEPARARGQVDAHDPSAGAPMPPSIPEPDLTVEFDGQRVTPANLLPMPSVQAMARRPTTAELVERLDQSAWLDRRAGRAT